MEYYACKLRRYTARATKKIDAFSNISQKNMKIINTADKIKAWKILHEIYKVLQNKFGRIAYKLTQKLHTVSTKGKFLVLIPLALVVKVSRFFEKQRSVTDSSIGILLIQQSFAKK